MSQEIQLSLTNRATHLCKCNDVPEPIFTHCHHAEFIRSMSTDVGENPLKFGCYWAKPCSMERGWSPKTRPHVCHHAKFGRSFYVKWCKHK